MKRICICFVGIGLYLCMKISVSWADATATGSSSSTPDSGSTPTHFVKKEQQIPSAIKFNLGLTLGSWVTDRAYQTSTAATDGVFDGNLTLSVTGYSWGAFYQGGWSAFFINSSLTRHNHRMTGEKRFSLPFLRGVLAMGGTLSWDDYADFYESYDRIRSEGYIGMKLYAGERVMLQAISTLGYSHYLNTSAYSHLYHTLSLQGTTWFPTRTTIRLQADWTLKHFPINPTNSTGSTSVNSDVTGSNRLQLYLRVAQSLGTQAALRVWGAWVPQVNTSYRFSDLQASSQVQNISDDLNAVYGGSAGLELEFRPRFLKGLRLIASSTWTLNHYGGYTARDSSNNALSSGAEREDLVWDIGAQVAWRLPFDVSGFWGSGIYLKASYLFRINQSNDARYTFNQHIGYLGVSTNW